jgi:hypothetical protein
LEPSTSSCSLLHSKLLKKVLREQSSFESICFRIPQLRKNVEVALIKKRATGR